MAIEDGNPVYFASGEDLDEIGRKIGLHRIVETDANFRQRIWIFMSQKNKGSDDAAHQKTDV